MTNRLFLALACVLLAVRLPSIVQPMGADQALYAYVGDRILDGGVPYRDAWDQKPPAVHLAYAVMRGLWPHPSAVPSADLVLAAAAAALIWRLGSLLVSPAVGRAAALLILFLGNPAFARLGGVSVRAQCESFIAAAVSGAFLLLAVHRHRPAAWRTVVGGLLFGLAFTFKYNAAVYLPAGMFALYLWNRLTLPTFGALSLGFVIPPTVLGTWLWVSGALGDAYEATIAYNLGYSGQTYSGPLHALMYLLTFPVRHARVDALWLIGAGGCAVLLAGAFRSRERLVVVAWVAAACLSIAINGSRDLPQYFVQAAPALALAAAWAGSDLWTRRRVVNVVIMVLVGVAVWRVNDFFKLVENTRRDARYAVGRTSSDDHLATYGDRTTRKYSALAVEELGRFLQTHARPREPVYVFGFSPGAYLAAERVSASRFFWSRPVIAGFNEGEPGYGIDGLLSDLRQHAPAAVALQQRDWFPDVADSATFFMASPPLASWLRASYEQVQGVAGFDLWVRRETAH